MPSTLTDWLPVVAAITSALSALIVYGFATGKFVQKKSDAFDSLETQHSVLAGRVKDAERHISDNRDARYRLVEDINRDLGRLGHKFELLEQRIAITAQHGTERNERLDDRLDKIEGQLSEMQRHVDHARRRT